MTADSASSAAPVLWLAIPAYNAGPALERFLGELLPRAREVPGCAVQLVDDGSSGREAERIRNLFAAYTVRFPALEPPIALGRNQGKGAAIRAAWVAAPESVRWLGFVDADGSVPAREVVRVCKLAVETSADPACIVGVRGCPGRTLKRRRWRRLLGAVFAAWARGGLGIPERDPQCGLKLVPAVVFRRIQSQLKERRFSFDVELLALLHHLGVAVRQEPIDWLERGRSTVRLVADGASLFISVVAIRIRRRAWPSEPISRPSEVL